MHADTSKMCVERDKLSSPESIFAQLLGLPPAPDHRLSSDNLLNHDTTLFGKQLKPPELENA